MKRNLFKKSLRFFADDSSHGLHKGDKPIKIFSQQINLVVKTANGEIQNIKANLGESLWDCLKKYKVGMGGLCEGTQDPFYSLRKKPLEANAWSLGCQDCMVQIESPWDIK